MIVVVPGAAPVTVTVCALSQFSVVNTNDTSSTDATVTSSEATVIVTSPVGAVANTTV